MATIPAAVSNGDFIKTTWGNAMATVMAEHVHDTTDGTTKIDLGDTTGSLPADTVGVSQLKIGTRDASTTNSASTIASSLYDFLPQIKEGTAGTYSVYCDFYALSSKGTATPWNPGTTYVGGFVIASNDPAETVYFTQRYVQASPPYPMAGSKDWGLWAFVIRDIASGKILSSLIQDDAPWGLIPSALPKMHPARIALQTTPWHSEVPEGAELVLVDLRHMEQPIEIEHPSKAKFRAMLSQRERWISQGHNAEELELFEKQAEAEAYKHGKLSVIPSHELRKWCHENGRGMCELIQENVNVDGEGIGNIITTLKESIEATNELKEKDRKLIPQAFRHNNIRILRNPSKAL